MIVVERPSEDGLRNQRWEFTVLIRGNIINLIVGIYAVEGRPSRRHKFRVEAYYDRLSFRSSYGCKSIERDDVPLPCDVVDEVKKNVMSYIRVGL